MIRPATFPTVVVMLAGALSACRERDGAPSARAVSRDTAISPGALGLVPTAPVTLWKGAAARPFEVTLRTADPATSLARRFGTITLRTSARSRAVDLGQ